MILSGFGCSTQRRLAILYDPVTSFEQSFATLYNPYLISKDRVTHAAFGNDALYDAYVLLVRPSLSIVLLLARAIHHTLIYTVIKSCLDRAMRGQRRSH